MLRRIFIYIFLMFTLVFVRSSWADTRPAALVIGNSAYADGLALPNAAKDAETVAHLFDDLGYRVTLLTDANREMMLEAFNAFREATENSTLTIFYFAGHGVHVHGQSFLFATDSEMTEAEVAETAIPLDVVNWALSSAPRQKVILIDACRTNPAYNAAFPVRPVASNFGAGTFIGFSAQPNAPAYDGEGQGLGPFASALVEGIVHGTQDLEALMRQVRVSVIKQTGGLQVPWSRSSLLLPIVLAPLEQAPVLDQPPRQSVAPVEEPAGIATLGRIATGVTQ